MGERTIGHPTHRYHVILRSGHISVVECDRCKIRRLLPERYGEPAAPPCLEVIEDECDQDSVVTREEREGGG